MVDTGAVKAYMVTVESSGFSADRIDNYIVTARSEGRARELAELELRADFPENEVKEGSEVYELRTDTTRVVGRLVNEDGT